MGKLCKYYSSSIIFSGILLFQLLSLSCLAQDKVLLSVQNSLATYNRTVLQEKIYVHTDKSFYIAGEVLWFKIYTTDGSSHQLLSLSKVGYVEVLDAENKPVAQAKIALREGEGMGSFHFPLTLSSGYYKLRAYTNWMKNFDAGLFFEKVITIINPLKAQPTAAVKTQLQHSIDFYPEGGSLVKDIKTKLAFKIRDQYGRGINGKGIVLNETNDTVAVFEPLKFGIGSFYFLPLTGHTYKSVVQLPDGSVITKPLPEGSINGYAMNVEDKEAVTISVRTNNKKEEPVFLVAQARQLISVAESAVLKDGTAVFSVDKAKLREGVNQFTVFNKEGQPVCERLYFKTPLQNSWVTAAIDKESYASRQKINLSFAAKDQGPQALSTNISLTVYRIDSLQTFDEADISTYLWLGSDLGEWIESPSYYLSNSGGEAEQATDNLMLTQKWSRFKWETVLNGENKKHLFPLEYSGQLVTAKIIDAQTGRPAPFIPAFLSIPGAPRKLFTAQSDSAGVVQFDVKDYYGAGEAVIQTNTQTAGLYSIALLNPFIEKYSARQLPPFEMPAKTMDSLLEDYSIGMQVQNIYTDEEIMQFRPPHIKDTFPFFGRPSNSYALDNYKRFTTMEEVLREYVREVNVGIRNGKLFLKLFNEDRRDFFDSNILLLLNGIPLKDFNKIFSYDPLKFKTLDIVPHSYILGSSSFIGLVNFSTYTGDLKDLELEPHQVAVDYEGLQLQRAFYAPVYETTDQQAGRTPDFRNTLFWKDEVPVGRTTTELAFFTCDQKGRYLVAWQGIDREGKIITGRLTFNVQ